MNSAKRLLPTFSYYPESKLSCGLRGPLEWLCASLGDAEKAEAGESSWVRDDLLPPRTRTAHIAGELSPSKEWCAFEFSPADS